MRLFLMPTDVLFFRNARPFVAGEDTVVQSIFPPTPETLQGMLRALIASRFAPTLTEAFALPIVRELVGNQASYGRFRLTALTLGRIRGDQIERLFPAPAHLQVLRPDGRLVLLHPAPESSDDTHSQWRSAALLRRVLQPGQPSLSASSEATNLPDGLRPLIQPDISANPGQVIAPFERWLTEAELATCLSGQTDGIVGTPASEISTLETRIGIGLQHTRKTVEEGLLYQTAVVRMAAGYGFVVDVEFASASQGAASALPVERISAASKIRRWVPLPDEGWEQLGGERRIIHYKVLPDPASDANKLPLVGQQGRQPLLYLASPAYFSQGWRPESWATTCGPTPVAAAIPRFQLIGGWSLEPTSAAGTPKRLRRCVPAGSVYFFEKTLTVPGPYSDYGSAIGYGYAIEGAW